MPTHKAVDSDTFASLWVDAFDIYKHRTGIDLCDLSSDLALHCLHSCDSEDSVLDALEKTAAEFGGYREGSPKWRKFRQKLQPVITAVTIFIDAAGEGAASKSVPGGKSVFVAVGILLKATRGVSEKFDALVDLLESLGLFLRQLKIRSDVPFGNESKIVVVEILVEILKTLALATQMMKKNRIQHFVRELFKADDMKAVLDRLNKLTTIESRMTVAEMLKLVNQGQAWQAEASGLLRQIDQATLPLQRQNLDVLARLSELPHDVELRVAAIVEQSLQRLSVADNDPVVRLDHAAEMERRVVSIVEQSMQRISERSLSDAEPRAPENVLVIRLDYTCLIPSRAHLDFFRQLICSLIALSADEQSMIRRDMAALLPVLTTTGLKDIESSTYALTGLAAAINPATAIGLYTQTIVLYIAAYMIWRLIVRITRSIPSAPGIDTKHTIVVIDILGLEFRVPLERCATFEDFHSLIVERASKQQHKSATKYVLSRAYEVADGSNSAVIYPHIWARKIRAGMKLEIAVLLRRLSVSCPWCGQENTQALWIHCDCGRTFEVSAASQMGPGNTLGERSTAFIEEFPKSSQLPSFSSAMDSVSVKQDAEDNQDEMPFRKVHVIFDDSKGKVEENVEASGPQVEEDVEASGPQVEEDVEVPGPQVEEDVEAPGLHPNRNEVVFSSDVRNMDKWAKRTRIPLTTAEALSATYARSHRWLHALKSSLIHQHHWTEATSSDPRMLFSLETSPIRRSWGGLPAGPTLRLQLPVHATSFFSPERRVQWQMVFHSDIFQSVRKKCPPINDILNLVQCVLTGVVTLVSGEIHPDGLYRTTRGLPPVSWINANEEMLIEIFGAPHFRALRKACSDTATAFKLEVVPYR
ncbi:hypothetical protein MVEN_00798300 [Mycena venus]|uniref:Fungal STAND N-terminal Goodbye domain-containing protein n=1 Tax=Mycena venus TaxID=2733690 RepID=A0A8H6YLY1_9AGAR|nr:hypothetical protein MVEN_00798300 [Mycena venus]